MTTNSKIEWTDHTFNPWIGCTKVSEGCKHCYAETLMDKRYGKVQWGPMGTRVRTSAANWKLPLTWNKQKMYQCSICGMRWIDGKSICAHNAIDNYDNAKSVRPRVFCASLADVFERNEQLDPWRGQLWNLIAQTPNLDWLFLTKRPENVMYMVPWGSEAYPWPSNVWIGTSVENQATADVRIPALLSIPASVRFLSMEPLLGPVEIGFGGCLPGDWKWVTNRELHWVIVGGESGKDARPVHPDWVRSIRDQCLGAGVPFFFKQWGEWVPAEYHSDSTFFGGGFVTNHARGGKTSVKSKSLMQFGDGAFMEHIGKKEAGRLLDGQEWNQFPQQEVRNGR